MVVHMVVMGKLKLLTGGHSNWKLLAALFCPFALKLPFAMHMPASYADMAISIRLFLFRLNRIIQNTADRRWERALRLLQERAVGGDGQFAAGMQSNEDALNAVFMLSL